MTKRSNAGKSGKYVSGPIARKVIVSVKRHFQEKVTDLTVLRDAEKRADDLEAAVITLDRLAQYDPVHASYVYAQNRLSVLIEEISDLPMLDELANAYSEAHEEYQPSGPPISPLTKSYFTCWGAFDVCIGRSKKETFCTIVIDMLRYMTADEELIGILEKMQASRMGIFKHEGRFEDRVFLRELVTNREVKAIVPSGYSGNTGEIWFARDMPPPFDHKLCDYSVVFTTPCVLGKLGSRGEFVQFVEEDWLKYFERTLSNTGIARREMAYDSTFALFCKSLILLTAESGIPRHARPGNH